MRVARVALAAEGSRTEFGINIAPMVDIALVLLIVFMAAVPIFIYREATFPQPGPPAEPPEPPHIFVLADGVLQLDGEAIAEAELEPAISKRLSPLEEGDRVVIIDADDKASYARVMEVFAMVRHAGAEIMGVEEP